MMDKMAQGSKGRAQQVKPYSSNQVVSFPHWGQVLSEGMVSPSQIWTQVGHCSGVQDPE